MSKKKSPIRKGNPFKPSAVESLILRGMVEVVSLSREERKFNASAVAWCPRRSVKYLFTSKKETVTPASKAYMTIGVAIHEMVTDALHKANRLIFKEYKLPPRTDPDIRGIVDAIFFGPDGRIMGMEIKSCGNLPGSPRPEARAQATLYSALTGLDFVIVYVSRKVAGWEGKLMIKSFDLEATESDMFAALSKACLAHYASIEHVLPEIPPGFTRSSHCTFCPFVEECWEGEEEDIPTATMEQMEELYEKADRRASELILERDNSRSGILKHISRYASPEVRRKLESISWS